MTEPHRNLAWHFVSLLLMSVFSMMLVGPAHAFRPFEGTDAQVAPPRALETELQPMGYERIGSERTLVTPELVLNYGAGSGWEFIAEARRLMLMNPEGGKAKPEIEDDGISVKRVLRNGVLQSATGPSVATEAEFALPTTTERGAGVSLTLIVSQEWRALTFHVNGSIADTRAHEFGRFASVIAQWEHEGWSVKPIAELSIEREGDQTTRQSALAGILWEPRAGLTIDAGVRTGYAEEHEIELRSGLTWKKHVHKGPKI